MAFWDCFRSKRQVAKRIIKERQPEPYVHEVPSPRDIISSTAIAKDARRKALVIHLPFEEHAESVTLYSIADTNSMDGLMDFGHTLLGTNDNDEIAAAQIGDVIVFTRDRGTAGKRLICHQIIEEHSDLMGIYFRTKGIRNLVLDPEKVRIPDIVAIGFGIIW